MDESLSHDCKIFMFSLLLSSYFIYNSVGNIDENALNNISLIINLSKEIAQNQNAKIDHSFPSFLWVLRDFALQMKNSSGDQISQKEYLESALESVKNNSDPSD